LQPKTLKNHDRRNGSMPKLLFHELIQSLANCSANSCQSLLIPVPLTIELSGARSSASAAAMC
jgi:hypothetical protein